MILQFREILFYTWNKTFSVSCLGAGNAMWYFVVSGGVNC